MAAPPTLAPLAPTHHTTAEATTEPRGRHLRAWLGLGALLLLALAGAALVVFIATRPLLTLPSGPLQPLADLSAAHSPSWQGTAAHVPATCSSGSRYTVARALDIGPNEWICGRATAVGAGITVFGRVGGDVVVIGGSATIAGQVDGGVTAVGGDITLLRGAHVGGAVKTYGGTVHREANVLIAGGIQHDSSLAALAPLRAPFFVPGYGPPWPSLIFWGLAGVIIARFFRDPLTRVERVASQQFGASILAGAAATIGALVLVVLLVVTCLGIPVAAALLLAMWVSWVVGTVAVGFWLGQLVFRAALSHEREMVLPQAVVGVLMLAAAEAIPYVGVGVGTVVGCAGVGSVLLAFLRERRIRRLTR